MELAGATGPIAIEGPMAQNALYGQALAALSGRAVRAMTGSTGTSAGAALLARGVPAPGASRAATPLRLEPFQDAAALLRYAVAWKRLAGVAEGLNP